MDNKTSKMYFKQEKIKEEIYTYYNKVFSNKRDRHVQMQSLLPDLSETSKILDYGCGMGGISNFFTKKYRCSVDAVDISENIIEKAKTAFGKEKKLNSYY